MQKLINVHHLSIDMFRNVQPTLAHLFHQIREKEVNFINDILLGCVEHGEMKSCDTKRIAQAVLTVMDAIKMEAFHGTDARFLDKIDMNALEKDVVFTISLILDGLMKGEMGGKICNS